MFSILPLVVIALAGCGLTRKRVAPAAASRSAMDQALTGMSLKQLDEANLVLKVAFNKSLESWQGGSDDIVAGCKITGKEAENGLSVIKPWHERAIDAEAERLRQNPKSYRVPVDEENCERDCSCGLGLKIFEKAGLDHQSHSKMKDFKRTRSRLEAKAELITSERAEICSESATWICTSDFLKALKP